MNNKFNKGRWRRQRRGAVIALFAILLPVILVLCGVAINIAYMQLTRTQLQVATDAAARAAGRAFSEYQDVEAARDMANSTALLNNVAGVPLTVSLDEDKNEIRFGESTRTDNGYGRYAFTVKDTDAVRAQSEKATAIRITGRRDSTSNGPVRLFFAGIPVPGGGRAFTRFEPVATATATQLDRDIALILDRSGSMAESTEDIAGWYDEYSHWEYYYDRSGNRRRRRVWTDTEKRDAYNNYYQQYNDWANGDAGPPDASRWKSLEVAVNEFLNVLGNTDQEELVSVATFSTTSRLDLELVSDAADGNFTGTVSENYQVIRNLVANTNVSGWTAIGQGLEEGLPTLFTSFARPYAAKTIVLLTDGINNQNPDPVEVAREIVGQYNVTIHTVTFSYDADETAMQEVAEIGGGKHYHAETTDQIVEIFREIANNLPTIITE